MSLGKFHNRLCRLCDNYEAWDGTSETEISDNVFTRGLLYSLIAAVLALIGQSPTLASDLEDTTQSEYSTPRCDSAVVKSSLYSNIRIYPSLSDQTEISIAVNPTNTQQLLVGANVFFRPYDCRVRAFYSQGYYFSNNEGLGWTGSDTLPTSQGTSDPAVAFDSQGRYYYCMKPSGVAGVLRYTPSTQQWGSWSTPGATCSHDLGDKPHMVVDVGSGRVYLAYSQFRDDPPCPVPVPILFSRALALESGFSTATPISGNTAPGWSHGVNLALRSRDTLYAVWAVYNFLAAQNYFHGIGFNRSFDGGVTFDTAWKINDPGFTTGLSVNGTSGYLKTNRIRANGYPVLAVDTTRGINHGTLYVVWADLRDGLNIYGMRSQDRGRTWQSVVKVNDDPAQNGKDQWSPWVTVDPHGGVNVVFYDSREDPLNQLTEAWMARSIDGGETFHNFRVSEVAFYPCPIPGPSGYMGDYIGIAANSDYIFPAWNDNRIRHPVTYPYDVGCGIYQAFIARVPIPDTVFVTGNVSSSTWSGNVLMTGDVTIPPGATITVKPWTNVIAKAFSDNQSSGLDPGKVELIVKGTLKIEDSAGTYPLFTASRIDTSGPWYGIRIEGASSQFMNAGRCRIRKAVVGVTIDSTAAADTLVGCLIRDCSIAGIVTYNDNVRIINDTIKNVSTGYGIQVNYVDPVIKSVSVDSCQYGIVAIASKAKIRDSRIRGPGLYGIYNIQDPEFSGDFDTVYVVNDSILGHFTGAHLIAGYKAHCFMDSCEFITDTTTGIRSPYGTKAALNTWVKMRRTLIKNAGTAGYYSDRSKSNLGKTKYNNGGLEDPGNNSIYPSGIFTFDCGEEDPCFFWRRAVSHVGLTSTDTLRAENNWWGSSTPTSASFSGPVDWNPYLTSAPPGAKVIAGDVVADANPVPATFTLQQNYPNPFNAGTIVEYHLERQAHVRLAIYNVLGQLVRVLVDEEREGGRHSTSWDARDRSGRQMASGIYFYRIEVANKVESKKMILMR